jgi:hypothetical protein
MAQLMPMPDAPPVMTVVVLEKSKRADASDDMVFSLEVIVMQSGNAPPHCAGCEQSSQWGIT